MDAMHRLFHVAAITFAITVATLVPAESVRAENATLETDPDRTRLAERTRRKALNAGMRWGRRNPERWAKLVPPNADLSPGGVPFTFNTPDGPVQTSIDSIQQTILGIGHRELKMKDHDNLARLYRDTFEMIPAEFRGDLLDPALLLKLSRRAQLGQVRVIGELLVREFVSIREALTATFTFGGLVVNPIDICEQEIGWESGGIDGENSERCEIGDYAVDGIMNKVDFILKDDLTCIKNQGQRNTCVAHAVNANVETMIQLLGGVPENLSEQNLFFWGETETDFNSRYTEGLNPDEVYDALDAQDYQLQYEDNWNYNQSPNRSNVLNGANQFPNSCSAGYSGEMCTDYAFQAEEQNFVFFALYTYPAPAAGGWEVTGWTNIPDLSYYPASQPDYQIDTAILMLENEYPVHISTLTPTAFSDSDANGYVNYDPADAPPKGSHSILAVGWVENSDLPAGAPLDPDGRGYFVIKNSWGTDYADCGFGYLSHEFVRQWAYAFRYLDKVLL